MLLNLHQSMYDKIELRSVSNMVINKINVEDEFNFGLHDNQYYQDLLLELCSEEVKKLSPSEIRKLIFKRFHGIPVYSMPIISSNLEIFRVTDFKPDGIVSNLKKDYSYNPSGTQGRCNLEGQKIFYGALSPETAIKEKHPESNQEIFISKWILKNHELIFFGFDNTENPSLSVFTDKFKNANEIIFKNVTQEQKEMAINKLNIFNSIFSLRGQDYYHLSSALTNSFFSLYPNIRNFFVITYPSITQDKSDINFAFRYEFADDPNFLELQSVFHIQVLSITGSQIKYKYKNVGSFDGEKINWKHKT